MPVPRAERLAQIRALQAEGLTSKHIALRLGVKPSTVRNILSDPDGSKARAIKKRHGGICVECGGPTSHGSGNGSHRGPALRCIHCSQGVPRQPPDRRRRVPIRLIEIPLDRRMEAAHEACKRENGDLERQEILMAALSPSADVYWVAA